MTRTVSLQELDAHLAQANRLVRNAFASSEEEPGLDFSKLGGHLRAALELLGESEDPRGKDEIFCFQGHA